MALPVVTLTATEEAALVQAENALGVSRGGFFGRAKGMSR